MQQTIAFVSPNLTWSDTKGGGFEPRHMAYRQVLPVNVRQKESYENDAKSSFKRSHWGITCGFECLLGNV
jgi:hypothetical protein